MPDFSELFGVLLTVLIASIPAVAAIFKKFGSVSKETGELFTAIFKALEDGKVSGDEVREIIQEAKDIPKAIQGLRDKS